MERHAIDIGWKLFCSVRSICVLYRRDFSSQTLKKYIHKFYILTLLPEFGMIAWYHSFNCKQFFSQPRFFLVSRHQFSFHNQIINVVCDDTTEDDIFSKFICAKTNLIQFSTLLTNKKTISHVAFVVDYGDSLQK